MLSGVRHGGISRLHRLVEGIYLKMIYLIKLLYFFKQTPTPIPRSFFGLEIVMASYIWAGQPPGVARQILYFPLSGGGLSLPNFLLYYWVAVLVPVRWGFSQPK